MFFEGFYFQKKKKKNDLIKSLRWFSCALKVGVQREHTQMLPADSKLLSWETYDEDVSSLGQRSTITTVGLLEQLNVTRDTSDYLWYMTR